MKTKTKLHLMIMSALNTPHGIARDIKFERARKYAKLCATN
jgi:hypothetical protein